MTFFFVIYLWVEFDTVRRWSVAGYFCMARWVEGEIMVLW